MKYTQMPSDELPIFHNFLGGNIPPDSPGLVDQPSIDYGAWHEARTSYARHADASEPLHWCLPQGGSFVFIVFLCLDMSAQPWETSANLASTSVKSEVTVLVLLVPPLHMWPYIVALRIYKDWQ